MMRGLGFERAAILAAPFRAAFPDIRAAYTPAHNISHNLGDESRRRSYRTPSLKAKRSVPGHAASRLGYIFSISRPGR
jgi:hypothetical protein